MNQFVQDDGARLRVVLHIEGLRQVDAPLRLVESLHPTGFAARHLLQLRIGNDMQGG